MNQIKELTGGLMNLYENEDLCDIKLIHGKNIIHCHRVVLVACSTYFREQLLYDEEKTEIDINKLHYKSAESVVHFMYGGECKPTEDSVGDLMLISSMWKLPCLRAIVESFIVKSLNHTNAALYYDLTGRNELRNTQIVCGRYIREHFMDIYDLHKITYQDLFLLLELDEINVKHEDDVYSKIVEWLKDHPFHRDILGCIRMEHLSQESFESLQHDPFFKSPEMITKIKHVMCYRRNGENIPNYHIPRYWRTVTQDQEHAAKDIPPEKCCRPADASPGDAKLLRRTQVDVKGSSIEVNTNAPTDDTDGPVVEQRPLSNTEYDRRRSAEAVKISYESRLLLLEKCIKSYGSDYNWVPLHYRIPSWVDRGTAMCSFIGVGIIFAGAESMENANKALVLDIAHGFTKLPLLPASLRGPGLVHVGSRIYVMGGQCYDGNGWKRSNSAYRLEFNDQDKTWEMISAMGLSVSWPLAVSHGSVIYVLGGSIGDEMKVNSNGDMVGSVQVYDEQTLSWREVASTEPIPHPCCVILHGAVVCQGTVHVLTTDRCMTYDRNYNKWSTTKYPSKLKTPRISVVYHEDTIKAYIYKKTDTKIQTYSIRNNYWRPKNTAVSEHEDGRLFIY